ncbi:unnamed protein product [Rotaria magnacalcarata]|uniref:RNA helicase n=2 Tax=Rotaria magnacalcarata TaxID=392030 RepID=A0A819EPF7_9BILA|nr:unnamed protein product [Rotaria magnacalcarata]CAF2046752.1 unnamed protein product [Rotaria magnacalcarata]CAF2123842.1 unnamed protein product [Rotaria magnacalcarata]CAF3843716.1 unnamed protein product [Rotaria magnacalcarata]CAF3854303.1 unnamed protein product [Rotaria magnacalcarata]
MATSMEHDRQKTMKQKSAVPSYGPGNSLYSTTEPLTAQDIENYFRIVPTRPNSSINSIDNSMSSKNECKTVQYLRPTSFEQQQKEVQRLNKNKIDIVPYATFHEKKQLLPIDQTAYARDFQQRFDNEFLQRWNKGVMGDIDDQTTISSSTSQRYGSTTIGSSINNRLSRLNIDRDQDREHMSDIEGQTDPDGVQSEVDKEEIRQIFGISHALETFDDYKEIRQWINQDTTLPVYTQKDKILSIIEMNSIAIIQGNTGSGKSTQIPQYILDDYVKRSKPVNIVVTQPRRIAARSLCEHISHSRNWPVGQTIGYQTSLNRQRCELTRILYCTTGVLLQRLILTKTLQDFTHIILDEVHERDQPMDFLLILIRTLWLRNSQNVKIILMSATIEIDKLAHYFRQVINGEIVPAYQFQIGDRLFDVQEMYLEHIQNYGLLPDLKLGEARLSREAIDLAVKLIKSFDDEDSMAGWDHTKNLPIKRATVLVFLPGLLEIQTVHDALRFPRGKPDLTKFSLDDFDECQKFNYDIIPLHSDLSMDDQMNIFSPAKSTYRKIILATNIAESSITIPDVRYVIDFCLSKEMVCDPETNYSCLQLVWASKANCDQRRGRAGRVAHGKCYRLVKLHLYNSLSAYQKPALLQESLDRVILQAKKLNIGEPKSILALALEPPNINDIEVTILKLKEVGALTIHMGQDEIRPFDGDLTFLGKIMAELPIDIELSRLIALGHAFGLVYETVIIAACLSTKSIFKIYYKDRLAAYKSKFNFAAGTFCDCQAFLNVYKTWFYHETNQQFRTADAERRWAHLHNVDIKRLREVHLLIDELRNRLRQLHIFVPRDVESDQMQRRRNPIIQQQNLLNLKIIIAGAFYPNYYIREPIESEAVDRELSSKDPFRTIMLRNIPLNEGILYRSQIEQQLKSLVDMEDMKITFENTKALIEFAPQHSTRHIVNPSELPVDQIVTSATSHTNILPAVYFAVKARMTNHKIILQTFERSAALQRVERLRLYMSRGEIQNDMLHHERDLFEEHHDALLRLAQRQTTIYSLPQQKLPDIKCQYLTINISTVVDVNHFWAQYVDRETNAQMKKINDLLSRTLLALTSTSVEIGMMCAAPFVLLSPQVTTPTPNHSNSNNCQLVKRYQYYRARVTHRIDNVTVEVFFVDWGNTEQIPIDQLRALEPSLLKIAPLAFECQLWSIRPNIARYPLNNWPIPALNYVCSLILERQVEAEIKAVARNIVKCDILLDIQTNRNHTNHQQNHQRYSEEGRTTLRQTLINKGFAEAANEEHTFQHDYRIRRDAQRFVSHTTDLSSSTDPSNVSVQIIDIPKELCEVYERKEIGQPVTLTGPYSPLEANHSSCHYATKMRRVQIDGESINSVGLEEEQHCNYRRLLVAFGVHLSQTRQIVSLRHTTLMPSIRGLPALIAMIFAPTIELRLDEEGKMKTGVLCGLGFNPVTNTSLYPDHDMDIGFDVQISTEDLVRINEIRKQMNLALYSAEAAGNKDLMRSVRRTITTELQRLLEAKRSPNRNNYFGTFQWNRLNPDDRVPKMAEDVSPDHLKLFPLHDDVITRTVEIDDEYRLKMMYHLIWLREKATITTFMCQITCELCDMDFNFTSDLFAHLSSSQHRELVRQLQLTHCI